MLIDERRFSFIPQNKWNTLSKQDRKLLGSYKSYYRWYKETIDEIDMKRIELEKLKLKKEFLLEELLVRLSIRIITLMRVEMKCHCVVPTLQKCLCSLEQLGIIL